MKILNLAEFEELCAVNNFNNFIVNSSDSNSFDFIKSFKRMRFCSGTIVLQSDDNYLRIKSVKSISVDCNNSANSAEICIRCDDLSHIDGVKIFTIIAKYR